MVLPDLMRPSKTAEDVSQLKELENTAYGYAPKKLRCIRDYQIINNIFSSLYSRVPDGYGDVLEVVYHLKYEKTPDDYRLEVQDRISINLPYHPQYSSSVLVRSDGKITAPLIGDLAAESKTPLELAAELNREYNKYLLNPAVTVALEGFQCESCRG